VWAAASTQNGDRLKERLKRGGVKIAAGGGGGKVFCWEVKQKKKKGAGGHRGRDAIKKEAAGHGQFWGGK